MLKKVSIVLSLVAAFGLGLAFTAPQSAFAKDPHKKQQQQKKVFVKKNVQVKKNVHVNKNVHVKKTFVVGKKYNGHVWYGHHRHRWHGKWYDYGDGPCWINVDGEWFWNVLACP